MVLGTANFMAPEQAVDPRSADGRADLYGLGCTLYFLLTGRPPFPHGSAVERLVQHAVGEAKPLAALRPGMPAGVAAVVRRLMAKRPESRYRTPAEVADALEEFSAVSVVSGGDTGVGQVADPSALTEVAVARPLR
jgi:serine/threonine-protein kinase